MWVERKKKEEMEAFGMGKAGEADKEKDADGQKVKRKEIRRWQTKTRGVKAKTDTERGESGTSRDKQREGIKHGISDT